VKAAANINAVNLAVAPIIFFNADGFNRFQPTVGPKRSITVKAKYFYGTTNYV
jgi:hypothetical protein